MTSSPDSTAGSVQSIRSARSVRSIGSADSIASIGSAGSIASIGSAGCIASIGSAGSIAAIGSAGCVGSIGSAGCVASIGSVGSIGSILSIGSRRGFGAVFNRPVLAPALTALAARLARRQEPGRRRRRTSRWRIRPAAVTDRWSSGSRPRRRRRSR